MLVLTRKPGQRILVGEEIVITILENGTGRICVGIDAPPDVRILRGELCEAAVQAGLRSNLMAAGASDA